MQDNERQQIIQTMIEFGMTPEEAEATQAAAERIAAERRRQTFEDEQEAERDPSSGETYAEALAVAEEQSVTIDGMTPDEYLDWSQEDALPGEGSTIATSDGVIIAEQRHIEIED